MLHISYFEIIPESIASFEQAQWNGQIGATVCFFGGMGLTHLLSKIVRYFRRFSLKFSFLSFLFLNNNLSQTRELSLS